MTPWMRRIHKWLGLLIGLQFILWLASGLLMGLLDGDALNGSRHRSQAATPRAWPTNVLPIDTVLDGARTRIVGAHARWLLDRPVYELSDGQARWVVDAADGGRIDIDAAFAATAARASYIGEGRQQPPVRLEHSLETRDHATPAWRVDFADDEDTSVYVSAQTGQILEHRNSTWRLYDILWMLHIMDYSGREDYNNPILMLAGMSGLWLALTGSWLLISSFHVAEFIPRRWQRKRQLTVLTTDGTLLRSLQAARGDTVYLALARNGLQLPSNCGGGESCGLCEIRIREDAPTPTSADRSHLPAAKLAQGYRLACGLALDQDIDVEVADGAALCRELDAEVESVHAVTPFLREIVLKTGAATGPEYRAGAYIQIGIPAYSLGKEQLHYPDDHREAWRELALPEPMANLEPVRRAYSLAFPAADGRLSLLARFQPGRKDCGQVVIGRGSTYLYSLQPGDRVRFSGPFGDFSIRPGGREKIFIGGGAGMAPLRAMIHDCLASGAQERMHFWYGARSNREVPYATEMASLARMHPNFSWHPVLSEDPGSDAGLQGFVHEVAHDLLLRSHPALETCDFYLCGPPAMLSATRALLQRLGIAEDRIAFDDFKI